jgi:hypothetical protein
MNIYFELADWPKPQGGKYFASYGDQSKLPQEYLRALLLGADRVWQEEDNGSVSFTKNRLYDPWNSAVVDMKEFFWIKLRCTAV